MRRTWRSPGRRTSRPPRSATTSRARGPGARRLRRHCWRSSGSRTPAIFDGVSGSAGACHAARRGAGRLLRTERVVVAGVRTGAGTDQRMGRRGRPVLRRHRTADAGRAWRSVRRRAVGGGRRLGDRATDVLRLPGPGTLIRRSRAAQSRAVPSMARAAARSPGRSGVSAATSAGAALRVSSNAGATAVYRHMADQRGAHQH